jgi:predicted nucleic acid-binding protein
MRVIDTSILIDYFRGVPGAKTLICDDDPAVSMVSSRNIFRVEV